MKTTLEIPDALFRRAKATAAERGIALRELVSDALEDKLRSHETPDKPWMNGFGELRDLHAETVRINGIMDDEFGRIDPRDWQ